MAKTAAPKKAGSKAAPAKTSGKVSKPDMASINLGVMTEARTAQGAMQANSARMTEVMAALRKAGIAAKDIQTSGLNLNAQYVYEQNVPPRLTGYQASNQVTVIVHDLTKLGAAVEDSGRVVRRETITRPKLGARETQTSPERPVALPTFSESEKKADDSARETPGDAAVYFLEEEGPHGELRYEPTSELRDEA